MGRAGPVRVPPRDDFLLGDWLVQPRLNLLKRGEDAVRLRPRTMDVLTYLAARPGEVLPRAALVDAIWQRRFVADSVLTRVVFELRQALGDDPDQPRYLETVHKRGYRLIARVRRLPRPAGAERRPSPFVLAWRGEETPLVEGETVIGRAEDAAVRIVSEYVSRRHARVTVRDQRAVIEDLESKNGTYVGGARLQGELELHPGDRIVVGPAALVFRRVDASGSTATELTGGS